MSGRRQPVFLIAARWFIGNRHLDQIRFQGGQQVALTEVLCILQFQRYL